MRDLIKSIIENAVDYDKKYMKTKSNLHDGFSRNKTIEIYSPTLVVRTVFHENNKFYP